jgi:hypothetical protein
MITQLWVSGFSLTAWDGFVKVSKFGVTIFWLEDPAYTNNGRGEAVGFSAKKWNMFTLFHIWVHTPRKQKIGSTIRGYRCGRSAPLFGGGGALSAGEEKIYRRLRIDMKKFWGRRCGE